ncbi:MAG: hypothetical protein E6Z25_01490 [Negativicoccus succinicivorans]|uniref:hypothetical protein n=1 Tax=Negativicoccus succinicivorans TaxID=620903 RepID=UPI002910FEBD|nr:hypothetical protein [Negativicoccus succinicivorans]MDU5914725.1 hypothetical protein [Negativicoccus succinicivorans]
MNWSYVEPGFITEKVLAGRPVLLTVESFTETDTDAAQAYADEIWNWLVANRSHIDDIAPAIVSLKNAHWLEVNEAPATVEEILPQLQNVAAVYAQQNEGVLIYYDVGEMFADNSVVIMLSPEFQFRGIQIM